MVLPCLPFRYVPPQHQKAERGWKKKACIREQARCADDENEERNRNNNFLKVTDCPQYFVMAQELSFRICLTGRKISRLTLCIGDRVSDLSMGSSFMT